MELDTIIEEYKKDNLTPFEAIRRAYEAGKQSEEQSCSEALRQMNETYNEQLEIDKQEIRLAEQKRILSLIEEEFGKHNARILNQFQLQGKPDMPLIAYDERVCLAPAIEIATKETLEALDELKEKINES